MAIKVEKVSSYYMVTKIKEHKEIKSKLLTLIEKIPQNQFLTPFENISHTDWNLPKEYKREYLDFFYEIIRPYMEEIRLFLNEPSWEIKNGWFQQYYKNNHHSWHRHANVNFANVYYLELPDVKRTTKFRPIVNSKKSFNFKAKEGDLVTFPAMFQHTSERINNNLRKTIISFNSDFC